jgi:hypothetical protein
MTERTHPPGWVRRSLSFARSQPFGRHLILRAELAESRRRASGPFPFPAG